MTDEEYPEYEEPTNEQLAQFMVVIAPRLIGKDHNLQLDAGMLKRLIESDLRYYQTAKKHHRQFYDEQKRLWGLMMRGKLRCAHIRANGKRCPNVNEAGSFFCGLHKEQFEEEAGEVAEGG